MLNVLIQASEQKVIYDTESPIASVDIWYVLLALGFYYLLTTRVI